MSKIRLFKGKLENKEVQENLVKKGIKVATSGLLMASIASGVMLTGQSEEVHAETFSRVVIGGAFIIEGVPEVKAEVEVEGAVVDTAKNTINILQPTKQELPVEVVKTDLSLAENQIKETLVAKTYIYNPELAYSQYRKTIEFNLNENGGLNGAIDTIRNLLNYHGSRQFNLDVINTDNVKNTITVVVGFSPDLRDLDGDGYADKLNLTAYTENELDLLAQRYTNYLDLQGYKVTKHEAGHELMDQFTFRMNYNNGRIQKEYNYIMDYLDKKLNGNKVSIKVQTVGKSQIRVFIYKAN